MLFGILDFLFRRMFFRIIGIVAGFLAGGSLGEPSSQSPETDMPTLATVLKLVAGFLLCRRQCWGARRGRPHLVRILRLLSLVMLSTGLDHTPNNHCHMSDI